MRFGKMLLAFGMMVALTACDGDQGEEERLADAPVRGVYGGIQVTASDPVARSTVGFFSGSDYQTGHALIDGSGTIISPNVIVGAAHTCLNFRPAFVYFGTTPPDEDTNRSYSSYVGTSTYPTTRRVTRCVANPTYNASANENPSTIPPNDLALFFVDSMPAGFGPAKVINPTQVTLPRNVTLAGFGAYEDQWDNAQTTGMLPYQLRKVDSFITAAWVVSRQFQDGPNPGKGTCQGDSGGSVYVQTNQTDVPVLLGIPVSGPACSDGIGYNTDLRYFIEWIESTAGVTLTKAAVATQCDNGIVDSGETCDGGAVACTSLDGTKYASGSAARKPDCTDYDVATCVLKPMGNACEAEACKVSPAVAIPDNSATGITSTINVASFNASLAAVTVSVDIAHTYRGDLVVTLTSPAGTAYVLSNKAGGSADNLVVTLSPTSFNGQNPLGNWALKVVDAGSGDKGTLNNWTLKLTAAKTPVCGNGVKEGTEFCDVGSVPCTTVDATMYESGTATCASNCSGWVATACVLRLSTNACVTSPCANAPTNPTPIPDNNAPGITSTISVASYSGALVNVNVKVNITHTYRGDLVVKLVSPKGTAYALWSKSGGSTDNLNLDVNLTTFNAESPAGIWKLQVSDTAASDTGKLVSWSLRLR